MARRLVGCDTQLPAWPARRRMNEAHRLTPREESPVETSCSPCNTSQSHPASPSTRPHAQQPLLAAHFHFKPFLFAQFPVCTEDPFFFRPTLLFVALAVLLASCISLEIRADVRTPRSLICLSDASQERGQDTYALKLQLTR